jgi:hypothetical protein
VKMLGLEIIIFYIQRYVSNDQAYGKLLERKIDKYCKYLSNFPVVIPRAQYVGIVSTCVGLVTLTFMEFCQNIGE